MPNNQVAWVTERRLAIETIVTQTTPAADAHPEIPFSLAPYKVPLIDLPAAGFREGTRRFQVFTGPLAGVQAGLQLGSFVGDMVHRTTDFFRVDVRYIMARGAENALSTLNDMLDSDAKTLSWRLTPDVAGPLWGNAIPYNFNFAGQQVIGSPAEGLIATQTQVINIVLRLFYQYTFDIGERL